MYFIRFIIAGIILIPIGIWGIWFGIRKKNILRVILSSLCALIMLILINLDIPIENWFFRWNSPKDAFYYMNINKEIVTVLENENIAWIFSKNRAEELEIQTVMKDNLGWMISNPRVKRYKQRKIGIGNQAIVVILKHPDGGDYLILSQHSRNRENKSIIPIISDSTGREFNIYCFNMDGEDDIYIALKFIDISKTYYLKIEDVQISSDMLLNFKYAQTVITKEGDIINM